MGIYHMDGGIPIKYKKMVGTVQLMGNNQLWIPISRKLDYDLEKGDKVIIEVKGSKIVVSKA